MTDDFEVIGTIIRNDKGMGVKLKKVNIGDIEVLDIRWFKDNKSQQTKVFG